MVSWIVFLFLDHLGGFSAGVGGLFVDPGALAPEEAVFGGLLDELGFGGLVLGLLVVERRGEVHFDVSIDDADGLVVIFGFNFENVDFELA